VPYPLYGCRNSKNLIKFALQKRKILKKKEEEEERQDKERMRMEERYLWRWGGGKARI